MEDLHQRLHRLGLHGVRGKHDATGSGFHERAAEVIQTVFAVTPFPSRRSAGGEHDRVGDVELLDIVAIEKTVVGF